jgi:hypothetical protein
MFFLLGIGLLGDVAHYTGHSSTVNLSTLHVILTVLSMNNRVSEILPVVMQPVWVLTYCR